MTTTKAGSGVKTPSIVTDQHLGVAGGPNPPPRRYNVYRRCLSSSSAPIIAGSAPEVANNTVHAGMDRRSGTGRPAASTRNTARRDGRSPPSSPRIGHCVLVKPCARPVRKHLSRPRLASHSHKSCESGRMNTHWAETRWQPTRLRQGQGRRQASVSASDNRASSASIPLSANTSTP